MDQLSLGVMARSLKENEHRLPLHPKHLDRIPEELRGRRLPRERLRRAVRRLRRPARALRRRLPQPRAARGGVRRHPRAQAPAQRHLRPAGGPGALGLAALRAGRRAHPGRHRPAADAHRVRGDEPLEQGRLLQPPRLPQEQRARRLLLGAARPPDRRHHRRLRPAAPRGRHRLRCDGPWRRHRAQRARDRRRRRAHASTEGGRRLAHPLGPDRALRHRRHDGARQPRGHRARPGARWGSSSPSTTSSSTACCRTPTPR